MVSLKVNGKVLSVSANPDMSLLWVLRDALNLKGTKYGCGVGLCGICTVLLDGEPNHACMVPLSHLDNREITTIEGLERHHPVVRAWIEHQVPQCGYCQPGQILVACALLRKNPQPGDADVDAAMSGVLCRCGTYPRIRDAVRAAADRLQAPAPAGIPVRPLTPPTSPSASVALNDFIRINSDNSVTLLVNHSEMGQGSLTGLAMLVAEELEVDLHRIRTEFAPADRKYKNPMWGEQFTGGSSSIRGEWEPLRTMAAATRERLIEAAAQRMGVKGMECRAERGAVVHVFSGKKLPYSEVAEAATKIKPPAYAPLKLAEDFRLIGRSTARLEIPDMAAGRTVYGIDVTRPGQQVATVLRCPVFGGRVKAFDAGATLKLPGVRQVIEIESGIAVVADDFPSALRGREALTVDWDPGPYAELSTADIYRQLQTALEKNGKDVRSEGAAKRVLKKAKRVVEAVYRTPYLAHATLEPMNCVAHVRDDGCDVWVGTQSQVDTQKIAARISSHSKKNVRVHTQFLGGGFGRRLETDFVAEAVEISQRIRVPVQVIWNRADDLQHDKYRPAGAAWLQAALDDHGRPTAWFMRIAGSELVFDGIHMEYMVENVREEHVEIESIVPTGAWRSVGASNNAFAIESFVDELAHAAGRDPLEYRLTLLKESPRHRAVLEQAAARSGWGKPLPPGQGQGLAVYRSFGSWVAQVAEVTVQSNTIKVNRVFCVIDCGLAVNPDAVHAQLEGAIAFGLSAALKEEILLDRGRVTQATFEDYPILTLAEMPAVDIHIMVSTEPPGGVGEPGVPVIAPAVANAVFAATGKRLRELPLRLS